MCGLLGRAVSGTKAAVAAMRWGVQRLMDGVERQAKDHLWLPMVPQPVGLGSLIVLAGCSVVVAAGRAAMLAQPPAHNLLPPANEGIWNDLFPAWLLGPARAAALQQVKWLACAAVVAGAAYLVASRQAETSGEAGAAAQEVLRISLGGMLLIWPDALVVARCVLRQAAGWWRRNAAA